MNVDIENTVAVSWHSDTAGCDATVETSRTWFDIDRDTNVITFDYTNAPHCGRYQLDVRARDHSWFADYVLDTGVDCGTDPSTDNSVRTTAQTPEPESLLLVLTGVLVFAFASALRKRLL